MIGPNRDAATVTPVENFPSYPFTSHCLYAQHSKTSRIGNRSTGDCCEDNGCNNVNLCKASFHMSNKSFTPVKDSLSDTAAIHDVSKKDEKWNRHKCVVAHAAGNKAWDNNRIKSAVFYSG